jgi:uncharacterized membrane protein (DUF4010 family)
MPALALPYIVALGIGLLVGIERERAKGGGPERGPAGVRTFALAAVFGALAMALGGPLLVGVVVIVMAGLAALAYSRAGTDDPGLTTEVALMLVPMLGALAQSDMQLAAAIGVVVTILLAIKPALHRFVRGTLTEVEIADGLVLACATLVIWPLLPNRTVGPFDALNPHSIWLVVILLLAIGAAGHVAIRALGPRFGLPVSGLASGFVSSVATIGTMGQRARSDPAALPAAVAGGLLSSVATFVQMAAVLATVSRETLSAMAPMLAAGGGVILIVGGLQTWRAATTLSGPAPAGKAFSLVMALLLAALMSAMVVVAAAIRHWLGSAGLVVGAAVGGVVDTHAAAMSVASLVAAGTIDSAQSIIPILVAMTANATMKIIMAATAGGARFAASIGLGVALSMAAAWAVALWPLLGG